MSTLYEEMLSRLCDYREGRHLSQEEMGSLIGITQSHYSKVERGLKVLSGASLARLSDRRMDVDFVLTGRKAGRTELDERMERCREESREELARLAVWLVRRGMRMREEENSPGGGEDSGREAESGIDGKEDSRRGTRMLEAGSGIGGGEGCGREEADGSYTSAAELFHGKERGTGVREGVWYGIRRSGGYTQQQMADMLGINIKKYRDIEKENRIPDAGVLVNLYEATGIPPSVLLEGKPHNLNALNRIWEGFPESVNAAFCLPPGVGVLRASGFLDMLGGLIGRCVGALHFPAELVPLTIVRMFSSSAATGLALDIFKQHGPDSDLGRLASVMMGCTETIFYTMSVYFMTAKVKKTRWTLAGALVSTLAGLAASVLLY